MSVPAATTLDITAETVVDVTTGAAGVEEILRTRSVRTLFQPIVDLGAGEVVAYEALTRGPAGTPLERPDVLFTAARQAGLVAELDWTCRASAADAAVAHGLQPPMAVFVNAEPDALTTRCPDHLAPAVSHGADRLRVVLEITERCLLDDPATLLASLRMVRRAGSAIALDDVGVEPASVALMPFVAPDVIKVDLATVRRGGPAADALVDAVTAQVARSGAHVLAEGIEDESDLTLADAIGATLGQGWHLGMPAAEPVTRRAPSRPLTCVAPLLVREWSRVRCA